MTNENLLPYKIYGNNVLHPCSGENSIDNTIVVGSSGVGKTYGYLNNNLMYDSNSNYIAVMRKDTIEEIVGRENAANLFPAGFDVKIISADLKGVHFNPMIYMEDRTDIEELAKSIMFLAGDSRISPYTSDVSKAELNYLIVLLLTVRNLWGNPHGYNYHPEKYNLVTVCELIQKPYKELEEIVRQAVINSESSDFDKDKLDDCWQTLCARFIDNESLTFEQIQEDFIKVLLPRLHFDEMEDFLSGDDNIQLYDMFDIDEKAIVVEIESEYNRTSTAAELFLSTLRILMSKNIFDNYTKIIIDEFPNCGYIYKVNDLLEIRKDCSTDIIIQSFGQLVLMFDMGLLIFIEKANIIFIGNIFDAGDAKIISRLTGLSNYRQDNDTEIIINNGPGSKFHTYTVCKKI